MKAARYEAFGGHVEVADVPDPSPPPGGVVVEVHANGVCRSDWHGWMGHDPEIRLPHVPGHELSGTVVALGEGTDPQLVGRRVTVPFVLGCGTCALCAEGNQHICERQYQPGFTGWGSFASYVALPYAEENLVPLPESVSFTTAAGLGCRFATAFRAVVDQGQVTDTSTVSVWGTGGLGLSTVMIAASLGATVIALDIDDEALTMARAAGAAHTVKVVEGTDAVAAVKELSGGGVDVSFDTFGSTDTAVASIRSLRRRGRHVQVGLMVADDSAPPIEMWRLHAHEIEIFGSHGMQAWRYPAMLDMIVDGRLNPASLVTETFDLQGGVDHLMAMDTFPGTGFAVIAELGAGAPR